MLSLGKSIYVLTPDCTQPGVPVFLNVVLREFNGTIEDFPQMDEDWTNIPVGQNGDFPKQMLLISKSGKLLFDYYPFYNGFICSELFVSLIEKFGAESNFIFIPLTIIGQRENDLIQKKYIYLHPKFQHKIIDDEKSSYTKHKYLSNNADELLGDTGIKYYTEIVLTHNDIPAHIINVKDNLLSRYLFCSEEFMNEAQSNCYGIEYIALEKFSVYYMKQFYPADFRQMSRDTDYYLNKRNKKNQRK